MGEQLGETGYFSILRWASDATRDEAKNVAVVLVDAEGVVGGMRSAPISTISPRLREQGILDSVVRGLEARFEKDARPTLSDLRSLRDSLQHSLYLTDPQPVSVSDADSALRALYRAYVAPRGGGSRALTKGKVLDKVTNALRHRGLKVERGQYVKDFVFDLVIESRTRWVGEVLSFATPKRDWVPVEHDAGHFLYALDRTSLNGMAIVQPPMELGPDAAARAYDRVTNWFEREGVACVQPNQLSDESLPIDL